MILPKRKSIRLSGYDYSNWGYYFITICTHKRRCILSNIVGQGLAPAVIELTEYGEIAKSQLLDLEKRYPHIVIDKYVIMPNHIHAIIKINDLSAGASPRPTLSDVVCSYKSLTTLLCKKEKYIEKVFQNSFYDHIIRGEKDYLEIWEYIDNNPYNWKKDELYCSV